VTLGAQLGFELPAVEEELPRLAGGVPLPLDELLAELRDGLLAELSGALLAGRGGAGDWTAFVAVVVVCFVETSSAATGRLSRRVDRWRTSSRLCAVTVCITVVV
jgi:hypothetical protein